MGNRWGEARDKQRINVLGKILKLKVSDAEART